MKTLILTMLVACVCTFSLAQQVSLSYGRIFSHFDYENSQGKSLDNLSGTVANSFMVGYQAPIAQRRWFLNSGISFNRYGAKGSDNALDYYYWKDNYSSRSKNNNNLFYSFL